MAASERGRTRRRAADAEGVTGQSVLLSPRFERSIGAPTSESST
jgi:hypothetical protein